MNQTLKTLVQEMRANVADPQHGAAGYGPWGALRIDQRNAIHTLLNAIEADAIPEPPIKRPGTQLTRHDVINRIDEARRLLSIDGINSKRQAQMLLIDLSKELLADIAISGDCETVQAIKQYYHDKQKPENRTETIHVDVEAMLEESAAKAGIQADREEESLDRKPGISR